MMKRSLYLSVFMVSIMAFGLGVFINSAGATMGEVSVKVNEFSLYPTGDQWVELINTSASDINISNWQIRAIDSSMGANSFLINSTVIPAGGLTVYSFGSSTMDTSGGAIFLIGGIVQPIQETAYGTLELPGVDYVAVLPVEGQSALLVDGDWVVGSSTRGWFNNASGLGSSSTPPQLSEIKEALNSIGIDTNIADLLNPSNAIGLYFSKTNIGKIQFDDGINLTESSAVEAIKNLTSSLTFTTGTVAFSGDSDSLLKNSGATVSLYGLTHEDYNSNDLTILSDDESPISSSSPDYPVITDLNFDVSTQSLTFHTNKLNFFSVTTDFYDLIAPTITFSTPENNFSTNQSIVNIKVSSTENLSSAVIVVNGSSSDMTISNHGSLTTATYDAHLQVGENNYRVIATDLAGNSTSTADRNIIYDNIAPISTLSNLPAVSTYDRSISISVGGNGVVYYKYNLDNAGYSEQIEKNEAITVSGLSTGSHNIKVLGRDLAGNWQLFSTSFNWTVSSASSGGGGGGGGGGSYTAPITPVVQTVVPQVATTTVVEQVPAQPVVNSGVVGQVLGIKTYANGSLLRSTTTKRIYILEKYQKKWIRTLKELKKYKNKLINNVEDAVISNYPDFRVDGTLIRNPNGKIYVIKNGRKQHIKTIQELKTKYRGKKILNLSENEVNLYKDI